MEGAAPKAISAKPVGARLAMSLRTLLTMRTGDAGGGCWENSWSRQATHEAGDILQLPAWRKSGVTVGGSSNGHSVLGTGYVGTAPEDLCEHAARAHPRHRNPSRHANSRKSGGGASGRSKWPHAAYDSRPG